MERKYSSKEIANKYNVKISFSDKEISTSEPKSLDEAKNLASFWKEFLGEETREDISNVDFVYQKKDKELPLSYGNLLLNKLGFKIKPKINEGEIKYESLTPKLINPPTNGLTNMILNKKEWEKFNKLAKESETFSAPYVFAPEPLCYRIIIPLECILGMKFKDLEK